MFDLEYSFISNKIADRYLSGRSKDLKTAFREIMGETKLGTKLNDEQKKRLVERSNKATFQALYEKDKQAALRFPLLDPVEVLGEKTAKRKTTPKDYLIPPTKELKETFYPPNIKEAVDKWFKTSPAIKNNSVKELSTKLSKIGAAISYLGHKKSVALFNLEDAKEEFYNQVRTDLKSKDYDLNDLFTVFGGDKLAELKPRLVVDRIITEKESIQALYKVACDIDTESRLIKAAIIEKIATKEYLEAEKKLLKLRQIRKELDAELGNKINTLGR